MANLYKTSVAIELLRYIPFIDFDPLDVAYGRHYVMLNTRIQDYRSNQLQDYIRNRDLEYYVKPVLLKGESLSLPCICFGNSEGCNRYFLVVDTAEGYVY
jgi:uncharacterized protein YcaQ